MGAASAAVEEQVSQYSTQLQQYANMLQNTAAIPQPIYSSAMSDMQAVQNLMTQGTQLSFSNPGASMGTFSSFLSSSSGQLGNLTAQAQQYQTWSQQSKDGITAAMNALSQQNSQLSTDNNTMNQLQAQAASSTGQMQAIQNLRNFGAASARDGEASAAHHGADAAGGQSTVDHQQQQSSDQANWQHFVNQPPLSTSGTTYKCTRR